MNDTLKFSIHMQHTKSTLESKGYCGVFTSAVVWDTTQKLLPTFYRRIVYVSYRYDTAVVAYNTLQYIMRHMVPSIEAPV